MIRGGSNINIFEEQPHAKQIADAPEPTVRCEDPVREPVPVAGEDASDVSAAVITRTTVDG